jgi:hypothetical protein
VAGQHPEASERRIPPRSMTEPPVEHPPKSWPRGRPTYVQPPCGSCLRPHDVPGCRLVARRSAPRSIGDRCAGRPTPHRWRVWSRQLARAYQVVEPRAAHTQYISRLLRAEQQLLHDHLPSVGGWGPACAGRWLGSRPHPAGSVGLRPGRQRRFASCGFAALTVDCPSFDQVRAGYRVRPRSGHTARGV